LASRPEKTRPPGRVVMPSATGLHQQSPPM